MNTFSLTDLELSFSASSIMNHYNSLFAVVGNVAMVGYLADDHDSESPLENWDGMGKIFTCHRHSEHIREYEDALAIMTDGWDGYSSGELLDKHASVFKRYWIKAAVNSVRFESWALNTASSIRQRDLPEYLRYRAQKLLTEEGFCSSCDRMTVWDFDFTEDAFNAALCELRERGLVGDPHAVLLDVYSHGGERWSLAGQGMQCRFDTSRNVGVWVPDSDETRKEIVRRGQIYSIGCIEENSYSLRSGKHRYWCELDSGEKSPDFEEWHQAFEWLEKRFVSRPKRYITKAQLRQGEIRAARKWATSVLQEYNDWLSGDVYGHVVVSFNTNGDVTDPSSWNEIDSEECWGCVGADNAYVELVARFNASVECETKRQSTICADVGMRNVDPNFQLHI